MFYDVEGLREMGRGAPQAWSAVPRKFQEPSSADQRSTSLADGGGKSTTARAPSAAGTPAGNAATGCCSPRAAVMSSLSLGANGTREKTMRVAENSAGPGAWSWV